MTISYAVDAGEGRRADKNAFPSAEEAIEKAAEAARKLQRAVSVWEWDSERKGEWPQVPSARQHYCLVFPDGSTQKSTKGKNPYAVVFEESDSGSDDVDSVEKQLGLPTITLGSATQSVDQIMQALAGKIDEQTLNQLNRIGDQMAKASVERANRSSKFASIYRAGHVFKIGGIVLKAVSVDVNAGTVTLVDKDNQKTTVDAMTFAREVIRAEQEADAHHLTAGDVAILDDHDRVFVLDAADDSYVVLQDNQIQTIPDDVTRIRKASDAGDPEAKRVRRVWQAFFRTILKTFDVVNVEELDSEQKSMFFDAARRKWPKVKKEMLDKEQTEKEGSKEEQPQPKAPPAEPQQEPQPGAATASDPESLWDDARQDMYNESLPQANESAEELITKDVEVFLQKNNLSCDFDVYIDGYDDSYVDFYDCPQDNLKALLGKSQIFMGCKELDENTLRCVLAPAYVKEAVTESVHSGDVFSSKKRFGSSWSNSPTLLSYCMDILGDDVEASTKLAMSFMAASLRDATKLRAMKSMRKFDGHELPKDWFDNAMLLTEVSKRSNVRASKNIDLTPPKSVQKIAARALDRASKEDVTLPNITLQHAKLLTAGKPISLEAAERMHLYLTRHQATARSELLWDAWGGHTGKRWVVNLAKMLNPMQATVQKPLWRQLFAKHMVKMLNDEISKHLLGVKWSFEVANDGAVTASAADERQMSLFSQAAMKLGWKVAPVTAKTAKLAGIDRFYYQANRAYHNELGIQWTAELERVWQHRLAQTEKR